MNSIEITPDREKQMLDELASIAESHVNSSNTELELLSVDPETFPAQRAYHVEGFPLSAREIEGLGVLANDKFPDIQSHLNDIEVESLVIESVGKLLNDGNNVVLATNHGDLIDIALAEAAVYCKLYDQGVVPRSGIIISKIVSLMGVRLGENVIPAADALKFLCNDIFLTFPRTETIRNSNLGSIVAEDIDRNNEQMIGKINEALGQGGMLLGMAASGSVDKTAGDNIIRLETLSQGTSRIMMQPNTFVLPVAIWLQGKHTVFEICDNPKSLPDVSSTHAAMEGISKSLTDKVEGKTFKYSSVRGLGKLSIES